jgi:hypothetical protein
MFPIKEDSAYGFKYSVFQDDVEALNETEFIKNYLRGINLISLSWGWDIEKLEPVKNPDLTQKYNNYDIRLRKIGQSLKLFKQEKYFDSLNSFVKVLHSNHTLDTRSMKRYSFISVWPFCLK